MARPYQGQCETRIVIRLPIALREKLVRFSGETNRPQAAILREAVADYLAKTKTPATN